MSRTMSFCIHQVLQSAVCPERKRGMDSYLSALASVTEVRWRGGGTA